MLLEEGRIAKQPEAVRHLPLDLELAGAQGLRVSGAGEQCEERGGEQE